MRARRKGSTSASRARAQALPKLPALSRSRPTIVLADSDTHFGSVLAPVVGFTKANGQREEPTDRQRAGAAAWIQRLDYFAALKSRLGARLVYIHNGDITEGVKHKSRQRISEDVEDHIALARIMLDPVVELADDAIFIRGTEAHAGIGSSLEEAVASKWRDSGKVWQPAEANKDDDPLTHYRVNIDIDGVRFDLEHHVAGAARPWTKGGNIQRRAISAMYEAIAKGARLADYVIRGHTHIAHDTGDNPPQPRGIICRPWQWEGSAYAHRIASEFTPAIGCQYVVIESPDSHYFRWYDAGMAPAPVWYSLPERAKRTRGKR
jgi:hypothetical protein